MGQHVIDDLVLDHADREERRQRAVESLGVVDDGPRERFDRITRLACTVFGVPMSTITVLDHDRAWFPSSQGLDVTEVPREESFCDRVAHDDEPTVAEDTAADPRFAHLPAVTRDHVRFYAGHPLRDHNGNVVATFCLFDRTPRTLDPAQQATFRDMALWAQQELVASTEMAQAGEVQASMLPAAAVREGDWEVDGMCLPALAVGGDFYDYGVDKGVVHLGLGDVMGKGTGAALVGAGVRAALRGTHTAVTAGVDLGVTVTQVGRSLMPDLERSESFVTLYETAIDLDDGHTRYVDAGMGLCVLVRADGTATQLAGDDRPLGILPDDHWTEHQTTIGPGDRMLLFSDGLLDLIDDPDDWLGPVSRIVAQHDTVSGLLARIAALAEERMALDDVTAVAVYRHAAGAVP